MKKNKIIESFPFNEIIFSELVDNLYDAVSVLTIDGVFLYANNIVLNNLTGSNDIEKVLGKNISEFIKDGSITELKKRYKKVIKEQKKHEEVVSVEISGGKRWFKNVLIPFKTENNKALIISISNDITEQKIAEEKNKRDEIKIKAITDNAEDVLWTIDLDYNLTFASPSAVEVYGYSQEEVKNLKLPQIIAEESYKIQKEMMNQRFEKEKKGIKTENNKVEQKHIKKDGTSFYVEVIVTPLRNENGEITGFSGITRDITDRKIMEENLRKSNRSLHSLLISIDDIIFEQSKDGKFINVWMKNEDELFLSPESFLGKTHYEIFDKKYADLIESKNREALESWKSVFYEYDLLFPNDGRVYLTKVTPYRDIFTGEVKLVHLVRNITKNKEAENKLINSELRLKTAIQNANIGLWDFNIKNNEVYVNEMWNILSDEKCKTIQDVVGEWRRSVHVDDVRRVFKELLVHLKGETQDFETIHRIITSTDETKWINAKGRVTERDSEGNAARILGTFTDITVIKETENKLIEANKLKDKFFSIVAHDLRTPFHSLLGFLDILMNYYDSYDDKKKKEFIEIIHSESNHLFKLLENLLTWSRLQRGVMNFNPEEINILLVINETLSVLQVMAAQKQIDVEVNYDSAATSINADREMIKTVLRNLISNAVKFTNVGGEIIINISEKRKKNVDISITDNGIGIANYKIANIFDIGKTFITPGTKQEKGTGLGLILCKEFVIKNNGNISVKSKKGKGSVFTISFPKN